MSNENTNTEKPCNIDSVSGIKLKLIETIFLPNWNTTAIICEGGNVYVELMKGKYISKGQVRTDLGEGWNERFYKIREQIFDELHDYYKENYCH
tara:strand:+ start:112 stop:393 length:282 start_codon:yes stop_codon:yes gene_type:complete